MTSTSDDREVTDFFTLFQNASDSLDADALAGCFAESFMAADPSGAQPVPRAAFLAVLPRRKELFATAGIGRVTLTEITHRNLDEHYLLAHTTWTAERHGSSVGQEPVTLLSTFILRRTDDGLRIVFYLNHRDLDDIISPGSDAKR